jgi:hypothetical protein
LPDEILAAKTEIEAAAVDRIQIAQRHEMIATFRETHRQIERSSRKALKDDGSVVRP